MTDAQSFLLVSIGVLIAVVLPILVGFVRKQFPPARETLPPWVKKYGGLLLLGLVTALPALAIWKTQHPDEQLRWYGAFVVGFGWGPAIEKFLK